MDIFYSAYQNIRSKQKYRNENRTILVTSGSGFIGDGITKALLEKGCQVLIVDIQKLSVEDPLLSFLLLDIAVSKLPSEYDGTLFGVINLTGKSMVGKWTEKFKKEIYDSRV